MNPKDSRTLQKTFRTAETLPDTRIFSVKNLRFLTINVFVACLGPTIRHFAAYESQKFNITSKLQISSTFELLKFYEKQFVSKKVKKLNLIFEIHLILLPVFFAGTTIERLRMHRRMSLDRCSLQYSLA